MFKWRSVLRIFENHFNNKHFYVDPAFFCELFTSGSFEAEYHIDRPISGITPEVTHFAVSWLTFLCKECWTVVWSPRHFLYNSFKTIYKKRIEIILFFFLKIHAEIESWAFSEDFHLNFDDTDKNTKTSHCM